MRALSLISLFLIGCGGSAATSERPSVQTEAPEARAILARMQAAYRNAKTYRDEGTQVSVFEAGKPKEHTGRSQFRTRWKAPDQLTFELRDEGKERLAVWTGRSSRRTQTLFLRAIKDEASLEEGLHHLAGVSHGLTALAPSWLSEHGCRCSDLYQLIGTDSCGSGNTCFELAVALDEHHDVKLFIDTTTHALRKYVSHSLLQPTEADCQPLLDHAPKDEQIQKGIRERCRQSFTVDQTIEFNPVFDAPISEQEFDVDTSGAHTETPD
jgi:hypothetical protein